MQADLFVKEGGKIVLPDAVRERYHLVDETPLRLIETRNGILIVPLSNEPMSADLARELDEWQALGAANLEMFPYEEAEL